MAKEFVRKVRNISDVSKFNLNETLPADLVQDKTGALWYHAKNEHKQLANDNEVVHLTGDETISGKKTFNDLITAKDGISDEGDLDVKGKSTFNDLITAKDGISDEGDLDVKGKSTFNGAVSFKDDVPFTGFPDLPSGWTNILSNDGYQIRDKMLTINIFYVATQKAIPANTITTLFKIPNVILPFNASGLINILPGSTSHRYGMWEIDTDGTVKIKNYEDLPVQTGDNSNRFNVIINVPIK